MSPEQRQNGHSTPNPDAIWNVKAGSDGKRKSTDRYKADINVEEDSIIKSTDYSAGHVHDSNYFTELLSGEESAAN